MLLLGLLGILTLVLGGTFHEPSILDTAKAGTYTNRHLLVRLQEESLRPGANISHNLGLFFQGHLSSPLKIHRTRYISHDLDRLRARLVIHRLS